MVNTFSFCLYGTYNDRYYPGMLENIYLAGKYFPDWKVYVYVAPDVEQSMIQHLGACSNVVLRHTGVTGSINMIHRFYAIDEPEVDVMFVRDADSRIHWKDRWAIRDFMNRPQFVSHTIRDNIDHTARMMGGLWAIRKSAGVNVREEYSKYKEDVSLGHRVAHDQNFLGDCIYPKVKSRMLVHYSKGPVFQGEYAILFPFEWINDVYCGRIESQYVDRPQPKPRNGILSLPLPEVKVRIF